MKTSDDIHLNSHRFELPVQTMTDKSMSNLLCTRITYVLSKRFRWRLCHWWNKSCPISYLSRGKSFSFPTDLELGDKMMTRQDSTYTSNINGGNKYLLWKRLMLLISCLKIICICQLKKWIDPTNSNSIIWNRFVLDFLSSHAILVNIRQSTVICRSYLRHWKTIYFESNNFNWFIEWNGIDKSDYNFFFVKRIFFFISIYVVIKS